MNRDVKSFSKIGKSNSAICKIINHDQLGFTHGMQGWFNIQKLTSVIHHIKTKKNQISTPIAPEKAFNKIQHKYMIKILSKLRKKKEFYQTYKGQQLKIYT